MVMNQLGCKKAVVMPSFEGLQTLQASMVEQSAQPEPLFFFGFLGSVLWFSVWSGQVSGSVTPSYFTTGMCHKLM